VLLANCVHLNPEFLTRAVSEKVAMTIFGASGGMGANAGLVRGEKNWNSLYVALGFVLTIGGMIIQMITPLEFPWNLVMYVVFGAIAFRLFLSDRRFQDWVLGKIRSHEDEPR
jgi:hypothetical protein